jgi:hypothetical protein
MSEEKPTAVRKIKTGGDGKGVSSEVATGNLGNAALAPAFLEAPTVPLNLFVPSNQDILEQRRRADSRIEMRPPQSGVEGLLVGFLVNYDETLDGLSYQLRTGRWIVTSSGAPRAEGLFIIEHSSIAETHAVIKVSEDRRLEVVDHGTGHLTAIMRGGIGEPEIVGEEAVAVRSGDVLIFGDRSFHLFIIPG